MRAPTVYDPYLHGHEVVRLHPSVGPPLDVSLQTPTEVLEHGRPSRQHNVLVQANQGTRGVHPGGKKNRRSDAR